LWKAFHALGRTLGIQGDELKAARDTLTNGMYTRCLKILSKRLEAAGGEYFADQRFTVADLKAYIWIKRLKSGGLDHVPGDLPDRVAPNLVQHMRRVAVEPGVVAYYAGIKSIN
jgi:glutathione S-transferase